MASLTGFTLTRRSDVYATFTWQTDEIGTTEMRFGPVVEGVWTPVDRSAGGGDSLEHTFTVSSPQFTVLPNTAYRASGMSFDNQITFEYIPCTDGSCPINFTTLMSATGVAVSNITHESATITWTSPSFDSSTDYVRWGAFLSIDTPTVESNSTQKQVTITGLQPETQYDFAGVSTSGVSYVQTETGSFTTTAIPVNVEMDAPENLPIGAVAASEGIIPAGVSSFGIGVNINQISADTLMENILR